MPVSSNSRYANATIFDAVDTEGTKHPTIAMRRTPSTGAVPIFYQHVMVGMDTVESLAANLYHSSEVWWRIADANPLMFPLDWRPGMAIGLPPVSQRGRIERTRRF